jgi:UDP-N-acetylglucosamine 2-epimerase (non-hydrolysing)
MAGIMVVLGTRPEALKLVPVIEALRRRDARLRICVTGQHRDLLDQVLGPAGIRPDIDLDLMRPGHDLNRLTASMLSGLSNVLAAEQPDRVIVQGDTSSAMTGALAAHHLKIPVSHVEAGLRSGDTGHPWPEEFNRKAISVIADQHFAPTTRAAEALLSEGVPADTVHITGNTAVDALFAMRLQIAADPLICGPVIPVLSAAQGRKLILVTCHRRENHGAGLAEVAAGVRALSARDDLFFALALHPNPEVTGPMSKALAGLDHVSLLPPLDYASFVRLLSAAHIVLTDSGGVQEEAPALGKPVLILRETTERPEGIEAGTARLVGAKAQRIVAEACRLLDNADAYARMARAHSPYGDGRAAERIAAILTGEQRQPIRRKGRL